MNKALMSSKSYEYSTPDEFFQELDTEFQFTLDPCATDENAKCDHFFTKEQDGLKQSWTGERVFMNPPYGRELSSWIRKAYKESYFGALVVCLVPARTDTAWFHDLCKRGEIRFIRGRLRFEGLNSDAPFPSMVVVFRPKGGACA